MTFEVSPGELRATAEHLRDVSERMKDVLAGLQARLAGEGAAWGDDKIGVQFADGPGGYLAQDAWVEGCMGAQSRFLDRCAGNMSGAADSFEQADEAP
jgi:uncharacterized protein YukE